MGLNTGVFNGAGGGLRLFTLVSFRFSYLSFVLESLKNILHRSLFLPKIELQDFLLCSIFGLKIYLGSIFPFLKQILGPIVVGLTADSYRRGVDFEDFFFWTAVVLLIVSAVLAVAAFIGITKDAVFVRRGVSENIELSRPSTY